MRILFVNHTSAASGAEFALMRLITGVRRKHHVAVACPADRTARRPARRRRRAARAHPRLRGKPSPRPGPDTPQPRRGSPSAASPSPAPRARFDADILHANTPRAGLMGAMATRLGGPAARRARARARAARAWSAAECSRARPLGERDPDGLAGDRAPLQRGAVAAGRDPRLQQLRPRALRPGRVEPSLVREELGIAPTSPLLGQVAQITPWKAQDTSIRALAAAARPGPRRAPPDRRRTSLSRARASATTTRATCASCTGWSAAGRSRTASTSSASAATSLGSCASSTCRCSRPGTSRSPT